MVSGSNLQAYNSKQGRIYYATQTAIEPPQLLIKWSDGRMVDGGWKTLQPDFGIFCLIKFIVVVTVRIRSTPQQKGNKNSIPGMGCGSLWSLRKPPLFWVIQTLDPWRSRNSPLKGGYVFSPSQKRGHKTCRILRLSSVFFDKIWCHHLAERSQHVGLFFAGIQFSGHFVGQWSFGHQNLSQYFLHPEKGTKTTPVAILQSYLLRISVWWDVLGFNYLLTKCLDVQGKNPTLRTTKIAFGNRPGPIHFQTTDCQVGYFSVSGISPCVHMLPVLLRCNFPIFFAVDFYQWNNVNHEGESLHFSYEIPAWGV